jgi:hypothetical protein
MKDCLYTPQNSKKDYSYDEFRAYLLRNHSWWSSVAKDLAPSVLAYKATAVTPVATTEAKPATAATTKQTEKNKVVLSKATQRIKAGFDAITKAMGLRPKVEFLSVEQAKQMLATRNDLSKLIAGFNMTRNDLRAAVKFGIANELEQKGTAPLDIKLQTGWERGADGDWKYEIGDAQIKKSAFNMIVQNNEMMLMDLEAAEEDTEQFNTYFKLGDLINSNSEVLKKYPEAKQIDVIVYPLAGQEGTNKNGNFNYENNIIEIYLQGMDVEDINIDDINSTLNHEIQHYIQYKEGFALGANLEAFIAENEDIDWSYTLYKHLAGETEARNVQERMSMSPATKLRTLLESTEDVPRINQIVSKTRRILVEGKDFYIGSNGEILSGSSEAYEKMMKEFNWKELDSDYMDYDYLKSTDGKVLGFVAKEKDGTYKIYIDPTAVGSETPIHEIAGHIFLPMLKEVAPDVYNRGIELVKGSEYEKRLKSLGYAFKTKEETYAEALAQAVGDRGAKLSYSSKDKFLDWLKTMWQKVGDILKINISPEKLKDMKLGEFADFIAGSIVYGQEIAEMEAAPLIAPPGNVLFTPEQADAIISEKIDEVLGTTLTDKEITPENRRMLLGKDAYRTQAAGKIAKKFGNLMEAIKEDVKIYLTKGGVGIQQYTGAAKDFIKTLGDQIKKTAIIAAIAVSGIVGTMKAMDTSAFTAAVNSVKTELINSGILSPAIANESFAQIGAEIRKAFQRSTEKPTGTPSAPPVEAILFGVAIPIATRKRIYEAIKGLNIADAKEAATNVMQQDGISQEDINAVNAQIDERYEAVSDAQFLANHIDKLRAAQKLTAAQAKQLMHHFRNFLVSEEALQEAIEFVNNLAEKKNLMEKLAKAKVAFRKLKSIRNSKKLTIYDKQLAGKLATPRFYLLSEEEMDKVIAMATDFYESRLSSRAGKYTAQEMMDFFEEVGTRRPKRTRSSAAGRRATTVAMLQFSVEQALADFSSRLPLAAELSRMDLSVLGKQKDSLQRILNALKAFDETGIVYDLGNIVETVRALNDAAKLRKSPIIAKLKRLAAGGISAKLQFEGIDAADVRRILFGGWDRKAAATTAENNKQRLEIDVKFDKLGINLEDRFVLGAYAFLKELSGNQTIGLKVDVLVDQMNDLKSRIENAKKYGSDSETVEMYRHYYTGATQALVKLGVISMVDNTWKANENFDLEANVSDKVKAAWEYSREILQSKFPEYAAAMQSYHGRDFDEIQSYWPRNLIRTAERVSTLEDPSTQLPRMGNLGEEGVNQSNEIAGRNRGRSLMPRMGAFYVLDGYETLVNGLWDINATSNMSAEYAYTNALVNKTTLVDNQETNTNLKRYIVSSVAGILKDPLLFVDTRNDWQKATSILMDAATTTILNNFTQLIKQPMAVTQGFVTNPKSSMEAIKLLALAPTNPQLKAALNKFFNNTSEPYTSQLAHIELETAYQVQPNKYVRGVNNALDFLRPQTLIAANRFTQRVLLLSEYLAERKYSGNGMQIINDAENGFDTTALAAAENNAEAANSTANRHFLPMELKEAKAMKKFLYFLGTYTFVAVNEFFNNVKIIVSPGYTAYQKRVAWTQAGGFIVQQIMFQVASKAIYEGIREMGRDLDWLEEEDPKAKQERRDKYWYQTPAQVLMDIATGWLPSVYSDSIKLSTNWFVEYMQDKYAETEEDAKKKVELIFKRADQLPGPIGVVVPMFENVWKAAESKDNEYLAYTMGMAASMFLKMGDAYYILKLKMQAVKNLLSAEGNEDVFKAMRHNNPTQYKSYVDEIRRAGVPDDVLHFMAWREGDKGYYVPAKNAARFYQLFQKNYNEEYAYLKEDREGMPDSKIKQSARNAAAASTQYDFDPIEIDLTEILKSKK